MTVESNLESLGIQLPPPPQPAGNYVPAVRVGNLLYISGMLPIENGKLRYEGPVGESCSIESAQEAAKLCALNILAVLKSEAGSWENVKRLVQLQGFVYGPAGFPDSPKVLNGASDLMVAVLGDKGKHSRAAVTVAGLPLRAAVEIQAIAELQ